jgi:hypothetical protein
MLKKYNNPIEGIVSSAIKWTQTIIQQEITNNHLFPLGVHFLFPA